VISIRRLAIASVPVFALAAGGAFAQSSTSTVQENGSQNSATIDQALNTGTSNTATVNQGVGGNGLSSTFGQAQITQIGGLGSQISSTVQQNGANQYARTNQDGSMGGTQVSTVAQSYSGNGAIVYQGTSGQLDKQESYITQEGSSQVVHGNAVFVNQYGPSDKATIYQSGTGNDGHASAASPGDGPTFNVYTGIMVQQEAYSANTSVANQYSSYSGINVYQASSDGSGGTNQSAVNQYGTGNYNFVGLDQRSSSGGTSTSFINQNAGSNNAAYFRQWGTAGSILYSDIEQSGANNLAQLEQAPANSGANEYSYTSQTGQNSLVWVEQHGTSDHAEVLQTGQGSDGSNQSVSFNTPLGYINIKTGVDIYQNGSTTNKAVINQYSDYSGATIYQNGSSGTNTSTINQYSGGSGNYAGNMQMADGGSINYSTIDQNAGGSGNLAAVAQFGSGGITNNSSVTQTGNNNTAMVYQHR
jgi:hypothetical protein